MPGLGVVAWRRLLAAFGSPARVLGAGRSALRECLGGRLALVDGILAAGEHPPRADLAWLQGGAPDQPDLLFLRHMLPSNDFFGQSVWSVPEGVIGAAAEIMGPYYPEIVYCDTATFEAGGADACFAQDGATPVS